MKRFIVRPHHRLILPYLRAVVGACGTPLFFTLLLVTGAFTIGLSGLTYVVEVESNDRINTFFDAIYFSVTVLTGVGFGDIVPTTFWGRVISMAMMLLGTVIFVSYTAVFASAIIEVDLEADD